MKDANKQYESLANVNIGHVHRSLKNHTEAHHHYERAVSISREIKLGVLPQMLFRYADFLFELGEFDQANTLYQEALECPHISGEAQFNLALLGAKLAGIIDKNQAKETMKLLLKENSDPKRVAQIHYALYRLTNANVYREEAIRLYQKLWKKIPNVEYKDRLLALNPDWADT